MHSETETIPQQSHTDDVVITYFQPITLIKDYVKTAEAIVRLNLEKLIAEIQRKIEDYKTLEGPAYISQPLSDLREEAYVKYSKLTQNSFGSRRLQYRSLFYNEVDLEFEKYITEQYAVKDLYREGLAKYRSKSPEKKESDLKEMDDIDLALKLNAEEIDELILDWHVYVDKIVCSVLRCHFYKVQADEEFREFYECIKCNFCVKKKKLNKNWIRTSVTKIKKAFQKKASKRKRKDSNFHIDGAVNNRELYGVIAKIASGDMISRYISSPERHNSRKIQIKMKAYMLLLTQNLYWLSKDINELVDMYICSQIPIRQIKLRQDLDLLFDRLLNMEGALTLFDGGYLKQYFNPDLRDTSAGECEIDQSSLTKSLDRSSKVA